MAIGIGTNIASARAQRSLSQSSSSLSQTYERLSTGLRINRASDDSAGLSVASSLNVHGRVYTQGIRNLNDGISALQIADSAIQNLSQIVTRLRELAQQSANGSLSVSQRKALDQEAQALGEEYFRISRATSFNRMNLFDGSLQGGIRLQGGFGANGSIQSSLGGVMGEGTFGAARNFTVGSSPYAVALGDLNGDGILDSVTANQGGNSASVLLGNGDGSFRAATSFATGSNPYSVSLADLNGDGILDMVTANSGTNNASVLLGNGDGSFRAATSVATGSNPYSVSLADLNGDGILDMVTANSGSSNASVLLGNGDGSFRSAMNFATGTMPQSLALGDVNGDAILDLVTANSGSSNASVLLGYGDGSFGSPSNFSTGFTPSSVSLADLNGDGKLDVVTTNLSENISVFLGNGTGGFGAATTFFVSASATSVALGDLNGDGALDIVASNIDTAFGSVILGNGNGSFGAPTYFITGSDFYSAALGDLNGDGVLDVVSANVGSNNASVLLGDTREGVAPLLSFSLTTQADALQALAPLERKLNQLSAQRGIIGAFQTRISAALNVLSGVRENYSAAESRIRDADIAVEAAELARLQIKQQAATAVLSQANLHGQLVLKLLQ